MGQCDPGLNLYLMDLIWEFEFESEYSFGYRSGSRFKCGFESESENRFGSGFWPYGLDLEVFESEFESGNRFGSFGGLDLGVDFDVDMDLDLN